jgi:hypothetical protein
MAATPTTGDTVPSADGGTAAHADVRVIAAPDPSASALPTATATHVAARTTGESTAAQPGRAGTVARPALHQSATVPGEHQNEAPGPSDGGDRAAAGRPGTGDLPQGHADQMPSNGGGDRGSSFAVSVQEAGTRRGNLSRVVGRDLPERRAATDVAPSQRRERSDPSAAPASSTARASAAQGAARGARRDANQRDASAGRAPPPAQGTHSTDAAPATQSGTAPAAAPAERSAAPASHSGGHAFTGVERGSASAPQQPDASPALRPDVSTVTLRVPGPEGGSTRVRVDVHGDAVRARIVPQSAPLAAELAAGAGDARAALQHQGFATAQVIVRTPPATPAGAAAPASPAEAASVSSVGRSMDAPPNPRQSGREASQQSARDPAHWQGPRSHHRSSRERER